MMDVATTCELAPDQELPGRDLLLDPAAVADRLPRLLAADGTVDIDACVLVRVKYRVGESLRAVYRLEVGGRDRLVTARLFRRGRSTVAYERARAHDSERGTAAGPGSLRPVTHDPELGAVWWLFPRDRKLGDLGWLTEPGFALGHEMGLPEWRRTELVQYVPERSVTGRAVDGRGVTLAYTKAYGPGVVRPSVAASRHRHVAHALRRTTDPVSAPDCPAWSDARGLLLLEAMPGRPWSALSGDQLARAMGGLGSALAHLHGSDLTDDLPEFVRLRPDRVGHCADIIGRARPDVARIVDRLAAGLRREIPVAGPAVVLHGDCHPGNALIDGHAVSLVDLDQMGSGPAAADLGSLLARLRYAATVGDLGAPETSDLEATFLSAYAERRALPAAPSLAWHTAAALLVERALRSVNRVNRPGLAVLPELITAADKVLRRGALP